MNKQPKSGPRRAVAAALILIGAISLFAAFNGSRARGLGAARVLVPLIPLAAGLILLLKKPKITEDFWRTDDPGQAKKVLRKLEKVQGDAELMNIGRNAPLEEIARAAYDRVGSQKDLALHIRTTKDAARRLLALECLTDQGELMGLARSLDEPACVEAAKRIGDAGLLAALAEDGNAPVAARCAAYEKLDQPRMADAVRLASPGTPPSEREGAAERILQTGDGALIARAAKLALTSPENPQSHGYIAQAAKAFPDGLLKLAYGTWGSDLIKATAFDALGRGDETRLLRLASGSFPEDERREAAAQILASGDEKQVREAVERLLAGKQDSVSKQFLLDAAAAYPGIIQALWPRVRKWGRVDVNKHTDQTSARSDHVDFRPSYDPSMHHDGMAPSSDCADNGHTDKSSHTDNAGSLKGYLARFPKAVRGDD